MPIGVIMNFRDDRVAQDIYKCIPVGSMQSVEVAGTPPKGLLFHWSNPTESGLRVVDVWNCREDFDDFAEQQIAPALEIHDLEEPDLEIHETASFMFGLRPNS
ncbi:MAG: hypothetical protein NVSMB31_05780 [Vulcanimicrobiaceae bacterium]